MTTDLEQILVDSLRNTLHVMLCTRSVNLCYAVERLISPYPMISLFKPEDAVQAVSYLRQVPSWHAVLLDDHFESAQSRFPAAVAALPAYVPLLIMRSPGSAGPGSVGAPDTPALVAAKPLTMPPPDFAPCASVSASAQALYITWNRIQRSCIQRKLLGVPCYGILHKAMQVLFDKNPATVESWTNLMGMTTHVFRELFLRATVLAPKKIIALYHAYRIAFDCCAQTRGGVMDGILPYTISAHNRARMVEYVLVHRSELVVQSERAPA